MTASWWWMREPTWFSQLFSALISLQKTDNSDAVRTSWNNTNGVLRIGNISTRKKPQNPKCVNFHGVNSASTWQFQTSMNLELKTCASGGSCVIVWTMSRKPPRNPNCALSVHPCCSVWQNFLFILRLIKFPSYVYTTFSLLAWCIFMLFLHLAIINNPEMNMGGHIAFQALGFFSFGCKPKSGISGWYNNCFLFFFKKSQCYPHDDCIILYSTNSVPWFQFLHILVNCCLLSFVFFFKWLFILFTY